MLPINVRLIAATHRNLRELVAKGLFREDLYYRLNVLSLPIPTLKERGEDVLEIADTFLREFYDIQGKSYGIFSAESAQLLLEYDWPGNIRQFRNVMEQLSVMTAGGLIEALDVRRALQVQEFIVEDHKGNFGMEQATINVSTELDKKPAPLDFALFISVLLGRFFADGPFYQRVIRHNCFRIVEMLFQRYTAETLTVSSL